MENKICPFMSPYIYCTDNVYDFTVCQKEECIAWGIVGYKGRTYEDVVAGRDTEQTLYGCKLIDKPGQ